MNVSAIIVTRGNVDLQPVLDSLPKEWESVVYDNGRGTVEVRHGLDWEPSVAGGTLDPRKMERVPLPDLSVYGRYAAIEYANHDLIFVQDDDVIVSDPQAIVDGWLSGAARPGPVITRPDATAFVNIGVEVDHLCANMPLEFRHDGYTDSCLVGFGACFHRDLPARAFERFFLRPGGQEGLRHADGTQWFHRTCDVVFTALTPRVLVDVQKTDREFASDQDRMWRQPDHVGERTRMLELARKVRDA